MDLDDGFYFSQVWGNTVASADWEHPLSRSVTASVGGYVSRYDSDTGAEFFTTLV